jgi:hypothetical protein
MAWGAHRKGQQKNVPYATAVPLYFAWPDRWGSDPREVGEYVSNIDLAPTFCKIGGCTLGPYPSGQSKPDGKSLLGLLDQGTSLGRDALLESSLLGEPIEDIPGWAGVRTTPQSALGLWHYVEYADGERELYDELRDPYELDNLAGHPEQASVQDALAERLNELLSEGRVNRPDLSVWGRRRHATWYAGYNLFATQPSPDQTLIAPVRRRRTYPFRVDLRNNGVASDSFVVTASVDGQHVRLRWLLDGVDVTAQMSAGGVLLGPIAGAATRSLSLEVRVKRRFPLGYHVTIDVAAESQTNPQQTDCVTLVLRR